jgi:DNA-binding transcriptional LysR family regulator
MRTASSTSLTTQPALPSLMKAPRGEAGELVALLSDYQLDWVELHAVYPGGRRPSLKVRAFSDYFAAQLMHKKLSAAEASSGSRRLSCRQT